jgi:hypothetical protein
MLPSSQPMVTLLIGQTDRSSDAGSVKANGRVNKTCLGRVFNYKLGCFGDVHVLNYVDACPHLKLKTRPRFSPVSLSLSMTYVTITVSGK